MLCTENARMAIPLPLAGMASFVRLVKAHDLARQVGGPLYTMRPLLPHAHATVQPVSAMKQGRAPPRRPSRTPCVRERS